MAISSKKLLGGKGGALAVRPKTNLVPSKSKGSSIAKIGKKDEDPMLVIKTKLIKIEDILKGTLAAEKRAADEKRKAQEEENRSKQEEEVEKTPKSKEKGIKIPVPGKIKSFWGNIKKFIGTVIFGWLALQLMPLLPKLMPILKLLGNVADFLINIGGTILGGLVTFVDWGYKAVTATEGWIKDKFGEDAAAKFNSFTGFLTKTMNLVISLGMAAAAMGGGRPGGKPGGKPGGGRTRTIGDRARRMRRTIQTRATRYSRNVRGTLNRFRPSNLKQTGSNLLKRAGGLKQNIMQRGGNLWQGAKQLGKGALSWADNFAQKQLANVDNVIGGIKSQGAKWGKSIGGALDTMNPMKLGEKVKGLLKGQIDDILKNNKLVKQVLDIAKNPKKIGDILKSTAKNKNVLKLREGLKAAKKMKIGGVDKVIAAIMGVIDYALLGESPVNAILRALGGLLGYTAGFAIGAPFGGAPGFITGMAGGFVGEQAARLLAKGLVHMPTPKGKLGTIDDPFAKLTGLSPRKIVRDPDDTAMNDKLSGDQQKLAEKREKEDAKDITPVSEKKKEEKKVYPHKSPFKKGKDIRFGKKSKYKNRMFDLSRLMGGLTNKQYTKELSDWERKQVTNHIMYYTDLSGVPVSEWGWDHKEQKMKEAPKKGMGGVIPFQIGKKSIGGRINTRDAVGSKVPKINRPIKRKRRARTNTVVVAARQQVYIPGSSPTPAPKVVYTSTPVMLNGNMRS